MKIGVPSEVKVHEYRVGLVPGGAAAFVSDGHEVFVQRGAGLGAGIADSDYEAVGCTILETADDVWSTADMIMKVKEPIAEEYPRMQRGQLVYTYFHLAAVPELATVLIEKEISAVAYETIQLPNGALPLLQPMSEVAGRMAVQVGARCLEKEHGGRGVLLGGIPGVQRGNVVILGGGTVGTEAAKMAMGMGANVTILDINLQRLRYLDDVFGNQMTTLYSNPQTVYEAVVKADLVIGAVLIPGARAPHLVTRDHLRDMLPGSVVVDVSVDQGGCIETCRPTTPTTRPSWSMTSCTTHRTPTPSAARAPTGSPTRRSPTGALAGKGFVDAVRSDEALALGVNTHGGHVTYEAVARDLNLPYRPLAQTL